MRINDEDFRTLAELTELERLAMLVLTLPPPPSMRGNAEVRNTRRALYEWTRKSCPNLDASA